MYIETILTPRKVQIPLSVIRFTLAFWWITFGESGCQEMVPELPANPSPVGSEFSISEATSEPPVVGWSISKSGAKV
jgi:hypothetical protein